MEETRVSRTRRSIDSETDSEFRRQSGQSTQERKFLDRPFVADRWGCGPRSNINFPVTTSRRLSPPSWSPRPIWKWRSVIEIQFASGNIPRGSAVLSALPFFEPPPHPSRSLLSPRRINRRKVESFFAFAYYSFIRSKDEGGGIRRYSREYPPRLE